MPGNDYKARTKAVTNTPRCFTQLHSKSSYSLGASQDQQEMEPHGIRRRVRKEQDFFNLKKRMKGKKNHCANLGGYKSFV